MKNYFILFLLVFFMQSCKEPIDLSFAASDPKIVVDGYITNIEKQHEVRVSFSSGFNRDGIFLFDPVTDATVQIEDDQGQITQLSHLRAGRYMTPLMRALPDRSYKVVVILESERFESTFQELPTTNTEVDISFDLAEREVLSGNLVVNEKGLAIYANLDPVDEPVYYHWQQRHYYVHEAQRYNHQYLPPLPSQNRFCFVRDFDRIQLDIGQRVPGGGRASVELDFFQPNGVRTYFDYAIEVIQLTTNAESFEFWDQVQRQSQQVGSLFDPSPASIHGNITNSEGSLMLGFFGVYNENVGHVFFNNCELPREYRAIPPGCGEGGAAAARYIAINHPCYDCLNQPGYSNQVEKPSWWRLIIPALDHNNFDRFNCAYGGG